MSKKIGVKRAKSMRKEFDLIKVNGINSTKVIGGNVYRLSLRRLTESSLIIVNVESKKKNNLKLPCGELLNIFIVPRNLINFFKV